MNNTKKGIHFEVSERKILLRLFDVVFVFIGLFLLEYFFDFKYLSLCEADIVPLFVLAFYISIFGTVFEIYDLRKASALDVTFKNVILTGSVTVLIYLLTPFFTPFLPAKRLHIFYFYGVIVGMIFLWRLAYVYLIATPRFYKKILLVGEISNIDHIIAPLKAADPNYQIVGFINCEAVSEAPITFKDLKEYSPESLLQVIKDEQISEILVASYNSESITPEIYHDLMLLLEHGFTIREFTQVYEDITHRVPIQFVGKDFYKYFPFSRSNQNKLYLLFQRTFDILFSLVGLSFWVLILPLFYIGNLLGNRGPLFYTQERVGKNGEPFKIIKMRSMVINAETPGKAEWAKKNDSRITPFGMFLRRSRLDEIPQFINVLKGDMSVIGPRPERPYFVNELTKVIPFYETRHIIKPGLTGWAQVSTRYGESVDDSLMKLQYDLYYIKHRSFFLDLNIIVKTLSAVLYYRGQ